MRIDVITIFPDYLAPLELSLIGRARREGLVELVVHDLRVWTHDRHRTVDDSPLGGGAGMVMKPEPWAEAFEAVRTAGREQLGETRSRWSSSRTRPGPPSSRTPPRSGRNGSGSSSPAGATRGSTRGSTSIWRTRGTSSP